MKRPGTYSNGAQKHTIDTILARKVAGAETEGAKHDENTSGTCQKNDLSAKKREAQEQGGLLGRKEMERKRKGKRRSP